MPAVDAPAVDVAQVLAYELVDAAVVQLRGRLGVLWPLDVRGDRRGRRLVGAPADRFAHLRGHELLDGLVRRGRDLFADRGLHRGVDEVPGQRSHVDTERRPVGLVDVDRLRLDAFQLVVSPIAHEGAPSVDRAASTAASSL